MRQGLPGQQNEAFSQPWLLDADIVGHGDALMAAALLRQHESISRRYSFKGPRRQHYFRWAIPFNKSVGGRVGHVAGVFFT